MNTGKCTACGGVTIQYSESRYVCSKCHAEYVSDNMNAVDTEIPTASCIICKKTFPQNVLGTIKDVKGNPHKICRECYYAMKEKNAPTQNQEKPPVATPVVLASTVKTPAPATTFSVSTDMVKKQNETNEPLTNRAEVQSTNGVLWSTPKKQIPTAVKIAACAILGVAIVVGGVFGVGCLSRQSKLKKAEKLIASEKYQEAVEILYKYDNLREDKRLTTSLEKIVAEHLENDEIDEAKSFVKDYEKAANYSSLQKTIKAQEKIEEEDYVGAVDILSKLNDERSKSLSLTLVDKAIEQLLDEGQYVQAQRFLDSHSTVSNYTKLCDKIKYEALALYCASGAIKSLLNPSYFQLTKFYFYRSDSDNYPVTLFLMSGQNGYGGYASSWGICSQEDLSYLGSSSDVTDDSDIIAYVVNRIWKNYYYTDATPLNEEINCDRINRILSEGIKYEVDIKMYKKGSSKESKTDV